MNTSWHTYPSIFNLGHRAVRDLFNAPVNVEEKVDGSQFSFGIFEELNPETGNIHDEYELKVRSKGAIMHPDAPEKMFTKAVESVKERINLLRPGWTYRGEYLAKPKHNSLAYDRFPAGHIILFDVCTGEEEYLSYSEKAAEAARLGYECVPLLGTMGGDCLDQLRWLIDNTTSVLGGQKIEGVVCKQVHVDMFGPDKKALMAKFVSEAFKEVHSKAWKSENPTAGDVICVLGQEYGSQARWNKAIQHLREAGKLEDSPKDIGMLMKEIPEDILKECEDEMKEKLFKWAWPHIRRKVSSGFPEYYKDLLLKKQFEGDNEDTNSI